MVPLFSAKNQVEGCQAQRNRGSSQAVHQGAGSGCKKLKALDDIANRYFDRYHRVAGEVESRNVQARLGMKLDERLKKPPFETEDVPREDQIVLNQGQGAQGSITMRNFAECHDALITLFKNANASTLPHESAHWLLSAMRALNEMGVATEKMQQDIAAIDEWLNNQDYSADAVKKFARNAVGEDGTVNEAVARDEYFARAFEKYLKEGKFPENATNLLKRALQGLKRLLKSIYSDAITLEGIQMDKSITQFFDGIFAADYAVQETSKLYDILRSFNAETISMSKAEMADFEKALEAAKEDAESLAYLRALQAWNQGLASNSRKWRAEARAATVEKNVKRLPKARFMKVFSE